MRQQHVVRVSAEFHEAAGLDAERHGIRVSDICDAMLAVWLALGDDDREAMLKHDAGADTDVDAGVSGCMDRP